MPDMKTPYFLVPAAMLMMISCGPSRIPGDVEQWKHEIVQTERDFAKMVQEEGIEKAFITFADENAVLQRNNDLVIGKERIAAHYQGQNSKGLSWKPDFVEVSNSGDLGYTYGRYRFTSVDSSGHTQEQTGVFHTVWKRQDDRTWRFVWD
jgi:ketosteroid isomerase-like protein